MLRLIRPQISKPGSLWYALAWEAPMLPTPTTRTRTSPMLPSPLACIAFAPDHSVRPHGWKPPRRQAARVRGARLTMAPTGLGFVRIPGRPVQATCDRSGSFGLQEVRSLDHVRAAWVRSDSRAPGFGRLSTGLGSFGFRVRSNSTAFGFVWPWLGRPPARADDFGMPRAGMFRRSCTSSQYWRNARAAPTLDMAGFLAGWWELAGRRAVGLRTTPLGSYHSRRL